MPGAPGDVVHIPSRTRPGRSYEVHIALDGTPVCRCEAALNNLECWHVKYVREEMEAMNETSTALVPVKVTPSAAALPTERELSLIDRAAELAFRGAIALPKELNTPQKVAAVMLYGWELNLKPMTAIKHLYIVNGRVQPSAEVMAGIAQAREPDTRLSIVELTEQSCTMQIARPSRGVEGQYTVTWAEIERAGLAKSDMNAKYPRDRLRWHCTKRLLRIYAPDLINGMDGIPLAGVSDGEVVEEPEPEMSDLYNEGDDPIEGTYTEVAQPAATLSEQQRARIAALRDAIAHKHGAGAFGAIVEGAQRRWPYAVEDGKLVSLNLRLQDGDTFIRLLERCEASKDGVVVAECDPDKHEPMINPDSTLYECSVCGERLEEPPVGEPAQQGLGV